MLADVSENSGDIFKVGSVKTGKDGNGKDIWEDTFSPTKPLLMKIAVAAGIQFDPDRTYGTRVDENTYKAKAYGAMRLPDGTGKTHADEKVIQLDDEEANFRLEFMDKSIKGITDEKAAKAAAEMFAGKWIDAVNKWNRQCKACDVVILEGIMYDEWYSPLFKTANELYGMDIYAYYFDIPFEETVRRHNTRDKKQEFDEEDMRRWWREKDFSSVFNEKIITSDIDADSIVEMIYIDSANEART